MTDWKARCAELASYLQGRKDNECGWWGEDPEQELLDRTRAELDQPEQEGPPKNCWKELCAELVLSRKLADWEDCEDLWARAEAALAQPEPEGLTDEEMWDLYYELERDPIRLARAVLARWGGCSAKQ